MLIHGKRVEDPEAYPKIPTVAGHRLVRTSGGRSGDYYYIWFAGMPEVLGHFQQTLFHTSDPISRDATRFLYTLTLIVADSPISQAVLPENSRVFCHGHSSGRLIAQGKYPGR